jgi:hypothetical protein
VFNRVARHPCGGLVGFECEHRNGVGRGIAVEQPLRAAVLRVFAGEAQRVGHFASSGISAKLRHRLRRRHRDDGGDGKHRDHDHQFDQRIACAATRVHGVDEAA